MQVDKSLILVLFLILFLYSNALRNLMRKRKRKRRRRMRKMLRVLTPCFVWRPDIFVRACWRKLKPRPDYCVVKTAWGDWLGVGPRNFIGINVYMRGAHELPVCETLWRLAEPGETVADIGANIGVMTSVLSLKVGKAGKVFAFEAHPGIFRELESNVRRWRERMILPVHQAVSSHTGHARIREEDWFELNQGTATVERNGSGTGESHAVTRSRGGSFEVGCVTLDEALGGQECRLIKIDVEGHERDVLAGAAQLQASGRLRDIIFESSFEYPSPAHAILLENGYQVFDLTASICGPALNKPWQRRTAGKRSSDYVATLNSERATRLMQPRGWQLLSSKCVVEG